MLEKYGKVKKVYVPTVNNEDVMASKKIGFIIEIGSKIYKYETEQNAENADIMKDDKVNIIIKTVDNYNFVDIKKLEEDLNE